MTGEALTDAELEELMDLRQERLAWVNQNLLSAALRDEHLARAVCGVAGDLASTNETLAALIKDRMKPLRLRSRSGLLATLIFYGAALRETDARTAREHLRKFAEWRARKPISDKTI